MSQDQPADSPQPAARGFAQAGVRIGNERAVLTLIGLNPGASNAELARLSGLGAQTTSRIVADLEARALVLRGEVLRGRRGQPATPLFINPDAAFSIGIEIGWRHLEVVLFSMGGKTLATLRRSYLFPDARTIVALVAGEIATIRAGMTAVQGSRLVGVGIASPAQLADTLMLLGADRDAAEAWRDIDLPALIEQSCGLPVRWFAQGNAAAWSEFIAHPAPRPKGMAYLQVGTLVSSGIVLSGELWKGSSGRASDLGATVVADRHGRPTTVHLVASHLALDRQTDGGPETPIYSWDVEQIDPAVDQWLDDSARAIATAIMGACALLDLPLVIIGGYMPSPFVDRLVGLVRQQLAILPSFDASRPVVDAGRSGASAAAMGAAQLVLFHRYFSRGWDMFDA